MDTAGSSACSELDESAPARDRPREKAALDRRQGTDAGWLSAACLCGSRGGSGAPDQGFNCEHSYQTHNHPYRPFINKTNHAACLALSQSQQK